MLEVASESTADVDAGAKRDDSAALGILEYWRFDETRRFHRTKLAGDRLTDDHYEPVLSEEVADGLLQGYSAALNLIIQCHWQPQKQGGISSRSLTEKWHFQHCM